MTSNSMHSLAPLNEDSEQRMSVSDPDFQYAKGAATRESGLSFNEVQKALAHIDQLFPNERSPGPHSEGNGEEETRLSDTSTESRSRDGSTAIDPLSRHNAFGRKRVNSAARPKDFTFILGNGTCSVFRQDQFDERSFHGHHINSIALRERLDSKALDWGTVGRIQSDFAAHDKLSQNELQTLHEKVDKAQTLHRCNGLEDAERLYKEVLEEDPLNWDCLSNLAKISFAAGDYEKAKGLFERAVVCRPERDKTVYYLGHVLFKLKNLERAELIFRQVSESKRKNDGDSQSDSNTTTYHDAMAMLGLCLQSKGNLSEAQCIYDEVLRKDKDHVQTLCHSCVLKSIQGQTAEASKAHEELVALDPSHVQRVCPYLDSLFPTDSEMLHSVQDLNERWEKAPKGKVPSKSLFRNIAKKLSCALRAMKSSGTSK